MEMATYNNEVPPLLENLGNFVLDHYAWRHVLIAAGMFVQWEVTLVLSMYLIVNGYLGWGGFIVAIVIGVTAYETTLYSIGRILKDTKLGNFIRRKIPNHEKLERTLREHATALLFLSKFVAYLNTAVVVLSGWTHMPIRKFAKVRAAASFFWFTVFGTITYLGMSGYALIDHKKFLRNFEFVVVGIILFILFGSKWIAKKVLSRTTKLEERAEEIGKRIEKKLTDNP